MLKSVQRDIASGQTEDNEPVQALIRSAISRCYYFAFWKVRIWVQAEDDSIRLMGGEAHGAVIRHCQKHKNAVLQEIGQKLFELRDFRTDADYKSYAPLNFQQAVLILADSKMIVEKLPPPTSTP